MRIAGELILFVLFYTALFTSKMIESLINLICQISGTPTIRSLRLKLHRRNLTISKNIEQQKALYRVISKIRASLDLETIFSTTTKETCKLLRAERVAVYRFSDSWGGEFINDFEFAESDWLDQTLGKNTVWNDSYLQENRGGRYRNNETLVINDVRAAGLSQCHLDILEQFHIRAYATAPIFIGQTLWGILAAYQHSSARTWQDSEIQFLSQVAGQLGFAVQQAELLAEIQRQAIELREANHQQQILLDLITEIRESLDLDILFKTTTREVRKALAVDRVGIFKFHQESKYYCGTFVAENVLPQYDSAMDIKVTDRCFAEDYAVAYEQGRIQVVSDIDQAGLRDCHTDILKQFQVKSQIIMPLVQSSQLWGLLCIHQCSHIRHWKTSEVQFIKQLAFHFNVALDHANLLQQSRVQSRELANTVAALESVNQQLEKLTRIDTLTQVANRRYLDEVLVKEWYRLMRSQGSLSIILFDVDHFKAYNDHYGHPAGDRCLTEIAQAARSVLKRPTDLVARYGGEEFAVLLPETDEAGAIQVANEIRNAIAHLQIINSDGDLDGSSAFVTVSQGIACQIPKVDRSVELLVAEADQALYDAKRQGRDTWAVASHSCQVNPTDGQ